MKNLKSIFGATFCLVSICLVVTLAVAGTRHAFQEEIDAQEWQQKEAAMKELLPADSYEAVNTSSGEAYAAKTGTETTGYLFTTGAYGYGSEVSVMTAIEKGVVKEIRVLDATEETPGLGQNVVKKSFVQQFKNLKEPPVITKQKQQPGDIEALTGATKSSSAVVHAVQEALALYEEVAG